MSNVPMNQNFNEDFRTLCGDPNAPAFAGNFSGKDVEFRTQDIKGAVIDQLQKYHVHLGSAYVLTDPDILRALHHRDVSIVVQKSARLSEEQQEVYARLGCTLSKKSIHPRLAHCTPRNPVYADAGIPDGVRWYGNIESPGRVGAIPVGHHKMLISGYMNNRRTKVTFVAASLGSYNFSMNAPNSFESWVTLKNPAVVASMVDTWVNLYSVSERLNNRRQGMTPDLMYTKTPAPYAGITCPKCDERLRTYPARMENTFRCPMCGALYVY